MTVGPSSSASRSDGDVVARLRSEHGNIARLLLVLESNLTTIHAGDEYDARLLLDAVDYLLDYVDRFHGEREDLFVAALATHEPTLRSARETLEVHHTTVRARGAVLDARLQRVIAGVAVDRADVVLDGFAYCTALRRSMAVEESILAFAAGPAQEPRSARVVERREEDRYRALFEALTHRAGCDCSYVRSR